MSRYPTSPPSTMNIVKSLANLVKSSAPRLALVHLIIVFLAAVAPAVANAQTVGSATLTRWDVFAGTGGTDTSSTNATQNPLALAIDPADGRVWFVAQRPSLRLGRLDPSGLTGNYDEWAPVTPPATSGAAVGLAVNSTTGDVWFTTGGTPELMVKLGGTNSFQAYRFPFSGAVGHRFAVTPDGSAAYVPVRAGTYTGIYKVLRAGVGTTSVVSERWRFSSSSDDPRHLTMDSAGVLWFVNKYRNTLGRLDTTLASANLTQWTLPSAELTKSPAGIHLVNGPTGAATVCVVMENAVGQATGEAQCLDVAASIFRMFTRAPGAGFNFPQQVAGNGAGELFLTEQFGNAVSFIGQAGLALASEQLAVPLTGTSNTKLTKGTDVTLTVSEASSTPVSRTVTPSVSVLAGVESTAGHVRFALPTLAALPSEPGVARQARPVGLTPVVGDSGAGTGTVYIAESFDGPSPITTQMGAAISRLSLGGSTPNAFVVQPSSLDFNADFGGSAPAAQQLSIEEYGGRTMSWSATKTQGWLTLSPASGSTPSSLTVSVDPAGLAASGTPYADTITIDDGPNGASPVSIPVAFSVAQRPTMVVTPSLLAFTAVNTDVAPPAAKTFAISSEGGSALEWTAAVSIPGVEADLEVAGQPLGAQVSGTGPATVTLHIRSVPGTIGLRQGVVTITSSNASNPTGSVAVSYDVTDGAPVLIADKLSLTFTAQRGGSAPAPQTIRLTNTGGVPDVWGTIAPYTDAVQPDWLTISPAWGDIAPGATTDITVTVTPEALASGASKTGVITIDDHTGNSPPAVVAVALVSQAPTIDFSAPSIAFTATQGDAATTQTVTLSNTGDAPLTFTPQITVNNGSGWLSVSPTGQATLASGASTTFTITAGSTSLAAGTYTAQITVADPYSTNGSDTVFITLTVNAAAAGVISPSPSAVSVSASAGGSSPAAQTVTVGNTGGTAFTYSAAIAGGATWLSIASGASATVNPSGSASIAVAFNTAGLAPGTYTATLQISAAGVVNSPQAVTVTLVVNDTTAPVLTLPGNMTVSTASPSGASVSYAASATDGGAAVAVTCIPASGSMLPIGTTIVNCSSTDAAGNTATGSFSVTVTLADSTPPTLSLPASVAAQATSAAGAVVTFSASATDGGAAVTVSCVPVSGSTFALGSTVVTCSATDAAGNTATGSFTVTVSDTAAPVISGTPSNAVVEAAGPSGAPYAFVTPTASDLIDGAVTVGCIPLSGSTFALGVNTVTCTAADARGNTASSSFTVTVRDTTAPSLTVPANMTVAATSGSGAAVTYVASATDIVDGSRAASCTPASGSTFPVGTTTVTCTASDLSGNTSTRTFSVTVTAAPASFTLSSSSLYFKTGRLAYCNGLPVGSNWKDQGLAINNTGGVTLNYSATTATSWIRIVPATGALAAGASTTLTVSVDLSGLGRGIYQGSLTVSANGISTVVPVTLEIGNALPTLCLTPTYMTWGSVKTNTTTTIKSYSLSNVGDDPMANWTSTKTITEGTLTLSATSGAAPKTVNVSVKTNTKKGMQSAQVTITAPGAVQGTQIINLSWTVQ